MKTTQNGFIYMMSGDGTVIATSWGAPLLDGSNHLIKSYNMSDPLINMTANYIKSIINPSSLTATNFSTIGAYQSYEYLDYFFQATVMTNSPHYIIVNGGPSSDYVGVINTILKSTLDGSLVSSTRKILGISIGVFVFLVAISLIATYFWISKPLRTLCIIIDQVRKFDFSSVEGSKNIHSSISEFSTMQQNFFRMITEFAKAIKSNKNLVQQQSGSKKLVPSTNSTAELKSANLFVSNEVSLGRQNESAENANID